ncbi:amidase [Neoroseomonas lacus]|uniref:Glutamyl-tRNA(Gln) amidotransferase subunit A n=1 Tax=Neoroseomonas lacus TaxID=287609 RepID=A0A917NXQ8_9PROT|nr:amidase [Neoroseomonas lacus]GGJ38675.1 glutamyl-tRNA(Gln) amidotransferase subunit A [Neoroseomonas lacus]
MPDTASAPAELHHLTIAEAAALIAARRLSPVELTRAFLARIEAVDPQLNAYLLVTADLALNQAREAEAEIMAGRYRGPLHGIPYALKDIYCTAGIRTTGHSRSAQHFVPSEDAETVARLRMAGAVLLGKLATHEFAHGGPSFDLPWPPARNPWDRGRITGGSSSGSGAAVAAGLAMGALGSDTGGSIRNPAALCGLAGLKPTYGLISRRGIWTNSFSYDHAGPMTWTVEDCALMLQSLAGHDPLDPASATLAVPDYAAALTGDIRGLRIGVLRHQYEVEVPVPAVVRVAMEAALEVLRGLGATLEEVRIRPAQDYTDVKIVGAESELYAVHEAGLRANPGLFGEDFLGRSLAAVLIRAEDYVNSQRERRAMVAEAKPLWSRFDALVTAGPGPAVPLDAWRTIQFWQKPSLTTPFNVLGGPALAHCIGYTPEGLPLSMQVVGAPFADATVMRIADAYERATPWRQRRPVLDPKAAFSTALPPLPDPTPAEISAADRDAVALVARRAGLSLNERQFELLCASAPYVEAMARRLRRPRGFAEEPSNVFRFTGYAP